MYRFIYFVIPFIFFSSSYLYSKDKELISDKDNEIKSVLQEIVGTWYFDIEYVPEYLKNGSELQKKWCGYGWSESEIKRRLQSIRNDAAKKGCPIIFRFSPINEVRLNLSTKNNDNLNKKKIIHSCRKQEPNLIVCEQTPTSVAPFSFRYDGVHFYAMLKITPKQMNCKIVSSSPSEIWLPVLRFKR